MQKEWGFAPENRWFSICVDICNENRAFNLCEIGSPSPPHALISRKISWEIACVYQVSGWRSGGPAIVFGARGPLQLIDTIFEAPSAEMGASPAPAAAVSLVNGPQTAIVRTLANSPPNMITGDCFWEIGSVHQLSGSSYTATNGGTLLKASEQATITTVSTADRVTQAMENNSIITASATRLNRDS